MAWPAEEAVSALLTFPDTCFIYLAFGALESNPEMA